VCADFTITIRSTGVLVCPAPRRTGPLERGCEAKDAAASSAVKLIETVRVTALWYDQRFLRVNIPKSTNFAATRYVHS